MYSVKDAQVLMLHACRTHELLMLAMPRFRPATLNARCLYASHQAVSFYCVKE